MNLENQLGRQKFPANISKIHEKFKQHPINIKNYTAHRHDMVHIDPPGKFRGNSIICLRVTLQKLNVTDRQTDGQRGGR